MCFILLHTLVPITIYQSKMSHIHTPVRKSDDWLTVPLECGDNSAWDFLIRALSDEFEAYLKWSPSCRKEFCKLYEEGRDCRYPYVVQIIHILGDDGSGGFCPPDPHKTYDGGLIRKLLNEMNGGLPREIER